MRAKQSPNFLTSLLNSNSTTGLESELPWSKDVIWQEYLKSYQKGEYNLRRDLLGLARMYFSGGISLPLPNAVSSSMTIYPCQQKTTSCM